MKLTSKKLKNIIKEEVVTQIAEQQIFDSLEEEINELWDDYSTDMRNGSLYVETSDDKFFRISLKNALDVKPILEVEFSHPEDSKYARRKTYYLHRMQELVYHLNPRNF